MAGVVAVMLTTSILVDWAGWEEGSQASMPARIHCH